MSRIINKIAKAKANIITIKPKHAYKWPADVTISISTTGMTMELEKV